MFSSVSSTWSLVRFWPANIGEGSSFRGEVAIDVRFTGVLMTGKECLVCAGDMHALESFSPRIRRPSLTGLNCTAVEFIVQLVEVGVEEFFAVAHESSVLCRRLEAEVYRKTEDN